MKTPRSQKSFRDRKNNIQRYLFVDDLDSSLMIESEPHQVAHSRLAHSVTERKALSHREPPYQQIFGDLSQSFMSESGQIHKAIFAQ